MKKRMRWVGVVLLGMLAACAVITVNIYFPEKDVKEAYKALEKELMTPDVTDGKKPAGKPESFFRFEFVGTAHAQEAGMSDKIADIVRRMPDVVNAYRDMGGRYAETERLRDSGLVGEGNSGLLVQRAEALAAADRQLVNAENADRTTVMNGMTKAIIRINRLPETPENMNQVLPQATEQFASIRRDAAKKGWWIQSPNGSWNRK